MTALSIPERAREIAERHMNKQLSGTPDFEKLFTDMVEEAMRSERELCAKELEAHCQCTNCMYAAKLLREGGQK